jgi:hypothetical protein
LVVSLKTKNKAAAFIMVNVFIKKQNLLTRRLKLPAKLAGRSWRCAF